ncbi:Hypothetical predicted protein [Mytilus galloprovincialis]|uniref:Uncharacterized protein n=1 Tax=Mytilus galloprovincialis TaxID=29158 RepID=A0A8B6C7Z7_MYTGA|nr:Hypothetical predicted protein [Mytilus galloprovincialis]
MARAMLLLIIVLVCVQQVTSGISVEKRNAEEDCSQGIKDDCSYKGCSYIPNGIDSCVCYCPGVDEEKEIMK